MSKEITQIINGLVSDIDYTIDGDWDAINLRTNVCKSKWARVGKVVADSSGYEYLITEIEIDEWIKTTPVDPANLNPLNGVICPFLFTCQERKLLQIMSGQKAQII